MTQAVTLLHSVHVLDTLRCLLYSNRRTPSQQVQHKDMSEALEASLCESLASSFHRFRGSCDLTASHVMQLYPIKPVLRLFVRLIA